jgi:AcrR family transcriptional regulator
LTRAPLRAYKFGMSTKNQAMRDRITDAALDVLRTEGMPGLTQPRVAKAAAMRQSHLTYYFPTRSALVAAVADRVAQGLTARFKAAFEVRPEALETALAGIGSPDQTRLLLSLVLASDREKPARLLFRRLTREIRASIAAGLARRGVASSPEAVALFHALCVGLAVLDLARGEKQSRQELRRAIRLALAQLETNGRRPS